MSDTVFDLSKGYPYRATQKKTRLNMMCVEEKRKRMENTQHTSTKALSNDSSDY